MANILQVRDTELYAEEIYCDPYKVVAYENENKDNCSIYTKVTIYKVKPVGEREQQIQELRDTLLAALKKLEDLSGPAA